MSSSGVAVFRYINTAFPAASVGAPAVVVAVNWQLMPSVTAIVTNGVVVAPTAPLPMLLIDTEPELADSVGFARISTGNVKWI